MRRPPRTTQSRSSAASDVYKRQVKGFKAKGKRITTYAVETINELEPTRFPEPSQEQQEVPEEEPENLDPDSGKSEGDIIDEITGQMKLF